VPFVVRGVERWSASLAAEWSAEHRRRVGRRQRACRLLALLLRSPRLTGCALSLVNRLPSLARPVVGRLNQPQKAEGLQPLGLAVSRRSDFPSTGG
jgi:hypothetical protein